MPSTLVIGGKLRLSLSSTRSSLKPRNRLKEISLVIDSPKRKEKMIENAVGATVHIPVEEKKVAAGDTINIE